VCLVRKTQHPSQTLPPSYAQIFNALQLSAVIAILPSPASCLRNFQLTVNAFLTSTVVHGDVIRDSGSVFEDCGILVPYKRGGGLVEYHDRHFGLLRREDEVLQHKTHDYIQAGAKKSATIGNHH